MTPIFLDTVGILALLEPSDQWHEAASRAAAAPHVAGVAALLVGSNRGAMRPAEV